MLLTARALPELTRLFEQARPLVGIQGQPLHGVPAWVLSGRGGPPAGAVKVGDAAFYPAACHEERRPVSLQATADPGWYGYRCPETFRWRQLAAAEVAVYSVPPEGFLHGLADLLQIPVNQRDGIRRPAVEGVLWRLGPARLGGGGVDIWCVRHLPQQQEAVFQCLSDPVWPERGLVLCCGAGWPGRLTPPRDYRFQSLGELLYRDPDLTRPEQTLLQRLTGLPTATPDASVTPVQYDPSTRQLRITSRPLPPWQIGGARQAAAIAYLFRQFQYGRRWVPAGEILSAVYGGNPTGRSQRLQNLFSGNRHWEFYLARDGQGRYGFRLE